jgi:hypothetical protein
MPRRKRSPDENKLKQGRGQGHGEDYSPYLTVREVPSDGLCHRIKGCKTNRTHHFLSSLERDYFYILEWSPIVVDIREQFRLEFDETLAIANRLGINHPSDMKTKEPIVMTTDFLIDFNHDGGIRQKARSIKMSQDLSSPRVIEKQEIERTFWSERGTDWGIVTEREIPKPLTENIQWIHRAMLPDGAPEIPEQMILQAERALFDAINGSPHKPLSHLTTGVDCLLGLRPGMSLSLVKYLLASRQWMVDMRKELSTDKPLHPSRAVMLKEENA